MFYIKVLIVCQKLNIWKLKIFCNEVDVVFGRRPPGVGESVNFFLPRGNPANACALAGLPHQCAHVATLGNQ